MRQELPPFEVPPDYAVEPELLAPIPRPVPDSISKHPRRLAGLRSTRRTSLVFFVLCVLLIVFRDATWVHVAGMYCTLFAYPSVVGAIGALLSLWGVFGFWRPGQPDPYRYLREGVVVVGRVVDLRYEVTQRVNGTDTCFAYDVYLEFPDPRTGEIVVGALRSPQVSNQPTTLGCKVGDYLTALYLPGQMMETLTLYGFTHVNPDRDLIKRHTSKGAEIAVVLLLAGIFAVVWGLFRYPIHNDEVRSFLTALVPMGLLGMLGGWWWARRQRAAQQARTERALAEGSVVEGETVKVGSWWGGLLGGLFCGLFLGAGGLMCLNGALDFRPATSVQVKVVNAYSTTYQGFFTRYELEYVDPETGKNEKIGISPLALERDGYAMLRTHRGALGWRWQEMEVVAEP